MQEAEACTAKGAVIISPKKTSCAPPPEGGSCENRPQQEGSASVTKGVMLDTEGKSQMTGQKNGIRFFRRNPRIQEIMENVFKILRKLFLNALEFCSQPTQKAKVPNIQIYFACVFLQEEILCYPQIIRMVVTLSCQPGYIWTHLGKRPLGMSMEDYLNMVN